MKSGGGAKESEQSDVARCRTSLYSDGSFADDQGENTSLKETGINTPYSVKESTYTSVKPMQRGVLQVRVHDVIINRSSLDKKLRDVFDDTKKCEKLFSIYLKLHTSS